MLLFRREDTSHKMFSGERSDQQLSRYGSLAMFREVFFVNKVHRKPKNLVARSWDCMIFMHRKGDCCERSKQKTQITKRHSAKYTAKYNVQITQIFF